MHRVVLRRIVSAGASLALVLALSAHIPSVASAAASTVVITSADLVTTPTAPGQFVAVNQSGHAGAVGIVFGPATPPLGLGSLQLHVTGTADHWSVYNYDHIGTPLSAITALSYATYTDNATTAPALQLEINPEPSGAYQYATLNFEPYMNAAQQTLTPFTWQSWNVLGGKVWLTHTDPVVNGGEGSQSTPISWAQLLTDYPNAVIKYGFGVNVGSGWSAMTGNADALTIGTAAATTTYDFEPSSGNLPFKSAGAGSESSPSLPGCQNSGTHECTVQTTGTAISTHLGKGSYLTTLTVYWGSATSNGQGGYCAPADGTGTLTAANGDTLTQTETGTVCEVGTTSLTAAHTFSGYFVTTGGTGRFKNASGEGTLTGGDDGSGHSSYSEIGTISY